ncbi:MAG TPA: hypothetical protein VLA67_04285 [Nitrospiraceae bacterium]|nr:hypothetical protein [Terriglobia bacterium]HSF66633.1 hypothetical protein [Nitrospiraceae bacterium]
MGVSFRRAGLFIVLFFSTATTILSAEEKISGTLTVRDSLTSPNQPATIQATLTKKYLLSETGLGGEPIELLVDGNVVATAMTGGDGRAILSYSPKAKGAIPFTVRVGTTPRVAAAEAGANLAVWERRSPILAVEMAALMEDPAGQNPIMIWPGKEAEGRRPLPDAAEELGKLTQFYYNVLYVATVDKTVGSNDQVNAQVRQWLKDQKFPVGHILVLPPGSEALGAKLDELHDGGWKMIKIGVGRTKAFAEAFLQRRLDAILVSEQAKGEVPRKAKVAKRWKDVRKVM